MTSSYTSSSNIVVASGCSEVVSDDTVISVGDEELDGVTIAPTFSVSGTTMATTKMANEKVIVLKRRNS
jgi:hypothetical protein